MIQTKLLHNVDGSAQWTRGVTRVLCSVSGPLEARPRDELPDQAAIELSVRPMVGIQSTRVILIKQAIYTCLASILQCHLHPRMLYQIVVQILEPGESKLDTVLELSAGINAATVACLDAGLPLSGIVMAVAVAVLKSGQVVFDPDQDVLDDRPNLSSSHVVAYAFANGEPDRLVLCESTGEFSRQELLAVLDQAVGACHALYNHTRTALEPSTVYPWAKE